MNRVSLSIVSHGHGRFVADLLDDLSRQTIVHQLDVVLTLNILEPDLDLTAFAPLQIRVIRNDAPKGFGANHNAALRDAGTTWVIVMNPDIRLNDATLIARLIEDVDMQRVGLVAPLICNSQGEREDSVRLNLDPISLFRRAVMHDSAMIEPQSARGRFIWVAGMFMALPLAAWRAVDGFDERFFLYCEDYDICVRLTQRGYDIKIDEALVAIHDAQRSSRRSAIYFRWHLASLLKVWTSGSYWRLWASDLRGHGRRPRPRIAGSRRAE